MSLGLYGFTCQSCHATFDSTEPGDGDFEKAHRQAHEAGWCYIDGPGGGFDGGWGPNVTCKDCSTGTDGKQFSYAVPLWWPRP